MSLDLPVKIVIENAQVRQRAVDAINKQLSRSPEAFKGDLGANSNQINAGFSLAEKRIRKITELISKGQDTRNPAIQSYFNLLDKGSQAAVTRLIEVKKALRDLREQKIDPAQFEIIKKGALSNAKGQPLSSQQLSRSVEKLIDDDIADYARLATETEKTANRIIAAEKMAAEAKIVNDRNAAEKAAEQDRKKLASLEKSVLTQQQKFIDGAQADQVNKEKAILKEVEKKNRQYERSIDLIRKQQQITRELLATVDKKSLKNPSNELSQLVRFANDDPRNFVAPPGPPGGGPPNKPPTGGGANFFNDDGEARRTVSRLRGIVTQQERFGSTVRRFGELAGLATKRYSAFLLGTFAITKLTAAFSAANQEALQFERLIGRLSQTIRVFNDTADQARERGQAVGDAILQAARRTGVASNEIAAGVVEIAQAGNEQLGALQLVADQLANTQLSASFDDIKSTAEGLIAVQGQFNLQLSSTGDLLDKINQVSVEYAVESGNFFEAVKRGGATFAGLGGTFEEFIEYLTLIRSATRETAPTLGVFFKTGLGRLSKSAQQQIFSEFGVDAPGQGRSVVDQLRDLSESGKFQQLSNTERIRTTIALFGAQQAGRGEALLRELGNQARQRDSGQRTVRDVIGGSAGSVGRDIKVVEEDVGRSLGRLTQSFQTFFNVLLQDKSVRSFFKNLADLAGFLADFVDKNRETLNFIVRLTAVLTTLVVALNAVKFASGIKTGLGLTDGIRTTNFLASNASRGVRNVLDIAPITDNDSRLSGFNSDRRQQALDRLRSRRNRNLFNFRPGGTGAAVAGIGLLGAGSFSLDSSIESDARSGNAISRDRRVASGGLTGATFGASIGLIAGPIGALAGGLVGGLIGALKANTSALKDSTQNKFDSAINTGLDSSNPRSLSDFAEKIRQTFNINSGQTSILEDISSFRFERGVQSGRNRIISGRAEDKVDFLNSSDNRDKIFGLLNSEVQKIQFTADELSDPTKFNGSLRNRLLDTANRGLNPENNDIVKSGITDLVNAFLTSFDSNKAFKNQQTGLANTIASNAFDTSELEVFLSVLKNFSNGVELSSQLIVNKFKQLSISLNSIVTDFTEIRKVSLPENSRDFSNSIGLSLDSLNKRRDNFVNRANILRSATGTSEGIGLLGQRTTEDRGSLIRILKELQVPTQGAASELEIVQNIENLVQSTLQSFSLETQLAVGDILRTLAASTGDVQSALSLFTSDTFDAAQTGDEIFQVGRIIEAIRPAFEEFLNSVNSLSDSLLANNRKIIDLNAQKFDLESSISDIKDTISAIRSPNEIGNPANQLAQRSLSDITTNRVLGTGRIDQFSNQSNRDLVNNSGELIRKQNEFSNLQSSGASVEAQARKQLEVTAALNKYETSLSTVEIQQSKLSKALDIAVNAVGIFSDALESTKGSLRNLGNSFLNDDPNKIRSQGNLVRGFNNFVGNDPNGIDSGLSRTARLLSKEQLKELLEGLDRLGTLPARQTQNGNIVSFEELASRLREQLGINSFGGASGVNDKQGRSTIESLLKAQKDNVDKAQAAQKLILEEQRKVQEALLTVNSQQITEINKNNTLLQSNNEALTRLEETLRKQVENINKGASAIGSQTLTGDLAVNVAPITIQFATDNLKEFGQSAVASALNEVGATLVKMFEDDPQKLALARELTVATSNSRPVVPIGA